MVWTDIFTNPTFYLIMAGIALFAYSMVRSTGLSKVPMFNSRRSLLIVAIGGFLITSGVFASLNLGSLSTPSGAATGVQVSDLQVTTAFTTDGAGATAPAENANQDDLIDIRLTDANVTETGGEEELYTGIITVTRTGSLEPASCQVKTIMPADYADEAGDDGRRYNILEKTTTGQWESYLNSGGAATINSPKTQTAIAFADGAATGTLGVAMEVDEEGHDALNQYSYKDVVIDICGKPFTFRFHRMD